MDGTIIFSSKSSAKNPESNLDGFPKRIRIHPEKPRLPKVSLLGLIWFFILLVIYWRDKAGDLSIKYNQLFDEPWRIILSPLSVLNKWQFMLSFIILFFYFGRVLEKRWGTVQFLYHFIIMSFLLNFSNFYF